jgi:GTP-binding protein
VGFPNAGKSTLISVISAARPKIANYPFTTLEPNLGVVNADGGTGGRGSEVGRTYVVADVPGLIEGASEGAGLGTRFLRHVERTRLLVHLIDTSDIAEIDPVKAYEIIESELASFSEALVEKPMIVVATKLDATTDRSKVRELQKFCAKNGLEFHAISAATGLGVKELVRAMADALDRIPKEVTEDETQRKEVHEAEEAKQWHSVPAANEHYVEASGSEPRASGDSEPDEEGPAVGKHR